MILGFYVVQWQAGVLAKLLTIMAGSFAITTALYDLVVKRTNVTRFFTRDEAAQEAATRCVLRVKEEDAA